VLLYREGGSVHIVVAHLTLGLDGVDAGDAFETLELCVSLLAVRDVCRVVVVAWRGIGLLPIRHDPFDGADHSVEGVDLVRLASGEALRRLARGEHAHNAREVVVVGPGGEDDRENRDEGGVHTIMD